MALKKVVNLDTGTADLVGGDDWDEMADIVNQFSSGAAGLFNIDTPVSTTRGTINTSTTQTFPQFTQTIGTTGATAYNLPGLFLSTGITATQATDPFDLLYTGMNSTVSYGIGPVAAKGSAIACASNMNIYGSGNTSNEVACFYAQNTAITGAAASQWLTDFNMHGPVGVRPGMLAGINMFVNNYYNGQPVRSDSYCIAAMTRPGGGGGTLAEHTAATSYKLAFGIGIMGYGGTTGSPTRGMEVGLKIGGSGCAWFPTEASKIGTGIQLVDMESIGIDLDDPATSASSPVGIKVTTTTRTWDTFLDLSSGLAPTTAAIKLGANPIIGTTMKLYEPEANTTSLLSIANTFSMLKLVPNISTVANTAARGILRVANTASGSSPEYIEISAQGTNGYRINATQESSGTLRVLNIMMGGNNCITVNTDNSMSFNNRSTSGLLLKFNDVTKVNTDSPYAILTTDDVIRANATSGALVLTLPTAVGVTGKLYRIMRIDTIASSNLVTVATTSSQTISNTAAWYLWPGEYLTVESDGANWIALAYSNPNQSNYYFLGGSTPNTRYIAGMIPDTTGPLQTSTTFPAANTLWALPFMVGKPTKFDQIFFNVTTGAAINARAGIYRDNGACYPGALIFDTGSIDCTAAVEKPTTITAGLQTFAPGLYWLAWECASNTIHIRILPANSLWGLLGFTGSANIPRYGYSVAHTYGALPDPYTGSAGLLNAAPSGAAPVPAIMLRAI